MELTKINVIKIMEEEKKNRELFNTNLGKRDYMNSVYRFVDTYIEPILKKQVYKLNLKAPKELTDELTDEILNDKTLSNNEKETMLKKETFNAYYNEMILDQSILDIISLVNQLGLIDKNSSYQKEYMNEDILTFLTDEEIGFLGKDKKIKKQVANKICDLFINNIINNNIDER